MSDFQPIILKPHQTFVIEYMSTHRALLLWHTTGSGKTLTSIYALYQHNYPIMIIGPKTSESRFNQEIIKAELDSSRFTFYTYTKIKKILEENVTFFNGYSVIVDEAHNIRNENVHNIYIATALAGATYVILLTATPVVNYMNEMSVLINIVKGSDVLPTERKLFYQMFYDEDNMEILNESYLREKMSGAISYYEAISAEFYPTFTEKYMPVIMSHEQVAEYIYYVKKILYEDKFIYNELDVLNIDYGLLPNKKRNFFLNVTRQLSNVANGSTNTANITTSPKIIDILDFIKSGPYPIVVYSNYLKNGIYSLAILLEQANISYSTITGSTTGDKLKFIVDRYNSGIYKVLLISSAGSESLDLKKTRQIHIMEPHWNDARIQQVIGRVIRYKSHEDLNVDQRHVDIYRWISVFPKQYKNITADEYLVNLSYKKKRLEQQYRTICIESSIEFS